MAKNINIPINKTAFIQGNYSKPTIDSTVNLDSLLVIMIHDLGADQNTQGNLYHDLEFILRDQGLHTLRFNLRHCGRHENAVSDFTLAEACANIQSVFEWARGQNYTRFVLIGEGLGGLLALQNHNPEVIGTVLLWPVLNGADFAKKIQFPCDLLDENTSVGHTFIEELEAINIPDILSAIHTPALVMQGAVDDICPIDHLDILRMHLKSPRIEITSFHDGVHGLPQINHRKAMYYHISQFIEKYA